MAAEPSQVVTEIPECSGDVLGFTDLSNPRDSPGAERCGVG